MDRLTTAGWVLTVALAIDVAIGLAHLVNLNGMPVFDRSLEFFDLGGEQNLPTWWSAAKLFLIGALLALLLPRLTADRRSFLVIGAAALAFAFLSLDEFASVHEFIGRRTRFDGLPVSGLWPFLFGGTGIAVVAVLRSPAGRSGQGTGWPPCASSAAWLPTCCSRPAWTSW